MSDQYAVIGNPVAQSQSPAIHAAFAAQTGQHLEYTRLEAAVDGFAAAAAAFGRAGGLGLNVTAPFKLEACRFATSLSPRAAAAGAVNALAFGNGQVRGENFDGVGLVRDITVNLRTPIAGRRVLVLGAGGAARGVLPALLEQRPGGLAVANRTAAKANALAASLAAQGPVMALDLAALADGPPYDIVLNATSSSLHGEGLAVPPACLAPGCLAYDLSYGRGATPFLAAAAAAGVVRRADGWGMLVEQAAEAFAWWRGVRPDTRPVLATGLAEGWGVAPAL